MASMSDPEGNVAAERSRGEGARRSGAAPGALLWLITKIDMIMIIAIIMIITMKIIAIVCSQTYQ